MSTEASPSTALTVQQRASVALGSSENEQRLIELAKQSVEITTITNPDGYQQCHSARMVLKNERIALEKAGKAAREDAQKFSKAVIAEEARLIGIIEVEEKRLQAIQSEWDALEEAKRNAEKIRIETLQKRISDIADLPLTMTGRPSHEITVQIEIVREIDISTFDEFKEFALEARNKALAALTQLHAGAVAQEKAAEEERQRREEEQAELIRLRAAEAKRKEEDDARAKAEAEQRAKDEAESRARIEAEQAESRKRIEAEEKAAREARAAEDARIAAERAEEQAKQDAIERERKALADEEAARLKAEQDRLDAERREVERQAQELMDGRTLLQTFVDKYGRRREFSAPVKAIKEFLATATKKAA